MRPSCLQAQIKDVTNLNINAELIYKHNSPYQQYQYQAHSQVAYPWKESVLIVQEYEVSSILPEQLGKKNPKDWKEILSQLETTNLISYSI